MNPAYFIKTAWVPFSNRVRGCLAREWQFTYLGDFAANDTISLLRLPNFGTKNLNEVAAQLSRFNLSINSMIGSEAAEWQKIPESIREEQSRKAAETFGTQLDAMAVAHHYPKGAEWTWPLTQLYHNRQPSGIVKTYLHGGDAMRILHVANLIGISDVHAATALFAWAQKQAKKGSYPVDELIPMVAERRKELREKAYKPVLYWRDEEYAKALFDVVAPK